MVTAAYQLSEDERIAAQKNIAFGESARLMSSTDYWKYLIGELDEKVEKALDDLAAYIDDEPHPDREEIITYCLKWHALRACRRLLLENVNAATNWLDAVQGGQA